MHDAMQETPTTTDDGSGVCNRKTTFCRRECVAKPEACMMMWRKDDVAAKVMGPNFEHSQHYSFGTSIYHHHGDVSLRVVSSYYSLSATVAATFTVARCDSHRRSS
jgi:hypothetical protein